MSEIWKVCSTCRQGIAFSAKFFECSVSTCTRKRTGFFFCSLPCWEAHVPTLRHRDAWAVEAHAPTKEQWEEELAEEDDVANAKTINAPAPMTVKVPAAPGGASVPPAAVSTGTPGPSGPSGTPGQITLSSTDIPREVLIVVSKLKGYVKARSGMNTSDGVVGPLSELVRKWMDQAIRNAAADGRKTVLDRDIPKI